MQSDGGHDTLLPLASQWASSFSILIYAMILYSWECYFLNYLHNILTLQQSKKNPLEKREILLKWTLQIISSTILLLLTSLTMWEWIWILFLEGWEGGYIHLAHHLCKSNSVALGLNFYTSCHTQSPYSYCVMKCWAWLFLLSIFVAGWWHRAMESTDFILHSPSSTRTSLYSSIMHMGACRAG